MRIIGIALIVSLVVVIGATLMGRAIDAEVRQHVLVTRNGETLDCERDAQGQMHSCVRVP